MLRQGLIKIVQACSVTLAACTRVGKKSSGGGPEDDADGVGSRGGVGVGRRTLLFLTWKAGTLKHEGFPGRSNTSSRICSARVPPTLSCLICTVCYIYRPAPGRLRSKRPAYVRVQWALVNDLTIQMGKRGGSQTKSQQLLAHSAWCIRVTR